MAGDGAHESTPSSSSSPDDAGGHGGRGHVRGEGISEYERQRLSRIQENRARLEALNLPGLSSSLFVGSSPSSSSSSSSKWRRPVGEKADTNKNKKGAGRSRERNGDEDDDDYQPSDEGNYVEEEDDKDSDQSSSYEEEEWATKKKRSSEYRRKEKTKTSSKRSKVTKDNHEGKTRDSYVFDYDDNADLQQAIALSLGGLTEGSTAASKGIPSNSGLEGNDSGPSRKKDKANMQKDAETRKRQNVKSRVQLTEDEVIAYFFSFDEAGKGYIRMHDLEKMAITHDFNWTDNELFSMIHFFDSDGDGKLSLEDFRAIVRRCNMLQVLEEH